MASSKKTDKGTKKESPYQQVAKLPSYEAWFNVIAWSCTTAWFCYSAYWASQEYVLKERNHNLSPGWTFLGRQRDVANFEWEFMRDWFSIIWPWFILQILLSLLVRQVAFEYRFYILSEYGVVILIFLMGYRAVLFLVVQCLVMYITAAVFRSALAVWTTSSTFLAVLNTHSLVPFLTNVAQSNSDINVQYYLLIFGLSMTNIRYTSFCLEQCHHLQEADGKGQQGKGQQGKGQQGKGQGFSFLDMLVYIFYFPVFFSGPLMTYDEFYLQISQPKQPWTKPRVMKIVKNVVRVAFWALFIEFILHYFYFNSMMNDPELLERLPRWALVGVGYCQGQFFMVKYVIIFGLPAIMTEIDHIKSPNWPKCISRIYLYSEMWKNFDVGLYNFIKRHIYVPLGGSQHGLMRQVLASFLCFVFIFLWHGAEFYLFVWTFLNYFGILLESMAVQVSAIPSVKAFERRWLSPTNSRRLRALATVPSFAMSILAIFIFFGGSEVGPIYLNKILYYGPAVPVLVGVLYVYIQTSIEVAIYEAEKVKQN